MSLRLKSELRLRLGPQHCDAAIWRSGWRSRPSARMSVPGANGESLDSALDTLVAEGHALPSRAALCVEDEYLYTLLLPASGAWSDANAAAHAQFAQMLGHEELLVRLSLAPCGTRWVGVALETDRLAQWRETLAARGIALEHVHPALLEDLAHLNPQLRDALPNGEGMLVLVRSEGASLIGLTPRSITHLEWERCDVTDAQQLGARIEAHCLQYAAASEQLPTVCIVPCNGSQRLLLEDLCNQRGWKLKQALDAP